MDHGRRTEVIFLGPAQIGTVDMIPDEPGTRMYHCHIGDHMKIGVAALYKVEP
jgi:manganese oxidase